MDSSTTPAGDSPPPCIICGRVLSAIHEFGTLQPNDGIMCETAGNYGSTVFDDTEGHRLFFIICDPCLVNAGKQGRVLTHSRHRLILAPAGLLGRVVVGHQRVDDPYVPWKADMDLEDISVVMTTEQLKDLPEECTLEVPLDEIRRMQGK